MEDVAMPLQRFRLAPLGGDAMRRLGTGAATQRDNSHETEHV